MIRCKNINFQSGEKKILKGIDLEIHQGEKIIIEGESGSGKSSLIKALLYYISFSGSIYYEGQLVDVGSIKSYRRQIAYLGQRIPDLNHRVSDFLTLYQGFRENDGLSVDQTILDQHLDQMTFKRSILDAEFNQLSGGEKQRIAVIAVLMLNKPIYIFDEITSALDPKNIDRVISSITRDKDRTVLLISHNSDSRRYFNRQIRMAAGEIVDDRYI